MGVGSAMYIGVSGLNSFSNALQVVSDNVANANTTGYKSNSVRFGDMVSSYYSTQSSDSDREGSGSNMLGISTDFGQGPMQTTTTWSDLAINGNGFFTVVAPNGGHLYTRDGGFRVDMNGDLVTLQGLDVLGTNGAIHVDDPNNPTYSNYSVDENGQIFGTLLADQTDAAGNLTPAGTLVPIPDAQLVISTFPNQDGLIRQGSNLYAAGPTSGTPVSGVANAGQCGQVMDLNIEGSNVDLGMEMVNMIIYQADYNANSKTISTAAQMLEVLTNLVR